MPAPPVTVYLMTKNSMAQMNSKWIEAIESVGSTTEASHNTKPSAELSEGDDVQAGVPARPVLPGLEDVSITRSPGVAVIRSPYRHSGTAKPITK